MRGETTAFRSSRLENDMAKPTTQFLLAQVSANHTVDLSRLIRVSDLLREIRLAVTSAPGQQRKDLTNRLAYLRGSTAVLCRYLKKGNTPENTLIADIIGSEEGFIEWLKIHAPITMRPIRVAGLRLLLLFARSVGFNHQTFAVENEWEKLPFVVMDHGAKGVIDALKRDNIYPCEVAQDYLEVWQQEALKRGSGFAHVRRSVSQFKYRIRQAGLEAQFPKLNLAPIQPSEYRVAVKKMPRCVAAELEGIVHWLAEQDEAMIMRMGKTSRRAFVRYVETLYGYVYHFYRIEKITKLNQLFTREIITAFGRWMYHDRTWNTHSISVLLRGIRTVLKAHPSFSTRDWNWILDLTKEFPEELESVVEHRRQKRAFNYDYETLSTIPGAIRKNRDSREDLSREEKGWMIHDELLMLWLTTYPWPPRCLRECRIGGDNPNLVPALPQAPLMT